ncbi:oligoendopeptidase F [Erysipelotrichaceae bacterium]|nr:oligoendopeptidase F [Erysipelotrichaceae bacterium]
MKTSWDLSALYNGFEDITLEEDYITLEQTICDFSEWTTKPLSTTTDIQKNLRIYIKYKTIIETLTAKIYGFVQLSLAVDVTDQRATVAQGRIRQILMEACEPVVLFIAWLGKLEQVVTLVQGDAILEEHTFYFEELQNSAKYLLSVEEETLLAKMKLTGSKAWEDLQGIVLSTLLVDYEGQSKPISEIRNLAYSSKAEIRKKAYEAELAAYPKIEYSMSGALNAIKGETNTIATEHGYKSALDQTLVQSRMDEKTLEVLLEAMVESLPKFQEYYEQKAKILGHENGLPFYDLFAPIGSAKLEYTYAEASKLIIDQFATFSEELSEMAKTAFNDGWIDVMPKTGKVGGAFCHNLHPIKQSRILVNFDGSFGNVKTLAHELGHAFHGQCLQEVSILNSEYTMPIAETASIFCETILKKAVLKSATKEEKLSLLEVDLQGSAQVIVDIYSRFLFEDNLLKTRKNKQLGVEELKTTMLAAQKQAYGKGLDWNALHPYMWINKPHYYSGTLSYYNFPYAYGLLFAYGIYAKYKKAGPEFVQIYRNLLTATGQYTLYDIAQLLEIDLHDINFWRMSFSIIYEDIEEFIQISS